MFVFSLESDSLTCLAVVRNFDLVGLDVFFTAFEKIISGFVVSLMKVSYDL